MITVCAYCKIELSNNNNGDDRLSHGACMRCRDSEISKIRAERQEMKTKESDNGKQKVS